MARFLLLALGLLLACGASVPENFDELPLDEQVEAYEKFYRDGGLSYPMVAEAMSVHGYPAARAMVPFLRGKRRGVPLEEALSVVGAVQARGCSLAGTEAEEAVLLVLTRSEDPAVKTTAEAVAESITLDRKHPELVDDRGAGACAD